LNSHPPSFQIPRGRISFHKTRRPDEPHTQPNAKFAFQNRTFDSLSNLNNKPSFPYPSKLTELLTEISPDLPFYTSIFANTGPGGSANQITRFITIKESNKI
jgi:hypothetical protein